MIALDTNILARYLVGDDATQHAIAKDLIENRLTRDNPGFVTLVVIAELSWVLQRFYGQTPTAVVEVVAQLLTSAHIVVEKAWAVEAALNQPHDDLSDALIHEVGRANGCESTVTFDQRFARLDGVELLV